MDVKLKLCVLLNDNETWTTLKGCHVVAYAPRVLRANLNNELPVMAALVYKLDDPKQLRDLADLIEHRR